MTVQTNASLTAIGNQLRDRCFPVLQDPLPSELRDLLAQLLALKLVSKPQPSDPPSIRYGAAEIAAVDGGGNGSCPTKSQVGSK
jgi:hypothetical protein